MKLSFCKHINIKLFNQVMISVLVGKVSHAQKTQNNKFLNSLQYLKKEVWGISWFLEQININI